MKFLDILRNRDRVDLIVAAVWIDDQPPLRPIAAFLAHHRTTRAVATTAIGIALAPIVAVVATAATAGQLIDQAHAVAGEGTEPCKTCVTAEADKFAGDDSVLTLAAMADVWDLKDGGLL